MAHQELDERKSAILSQIIEEYVAYAEPVGSKMIVDKYDWEVSPATMRAEMSELEEEGFTTHPHTSAGRMPTEKGYRWYVSSLDIQNTRVQSRVSERLGSALDEGGKERVNRVKRVAREVAEVANNAVVVGFGKDDSYYTGLSYLFNHPEFNDIHAVRSFSEMLDQLDRAFGSLFESLQDSTMVSIGSDNPFGNECSFVGGSVYGGSCVFGILGPLRMDYKKNIGLVNWVKENV